MRTNGRFLGVSLALAVSAVWFLGGAGAADNKEYYEAIMKIAAAFEKNDTAGAKTQAAALAKKVEDIEDVMHGFSLRRAKGIGVINGVMPDGIEAKIMELSKKPKPAATLSKEADAIVQLSYIAAAIGEVAHAKPPEKDDGKKKVKDWLTWSQDMRESALKLAAAGKEKNPMTVKTAAAKLYSSCTTCHEVFKDK
jgi:hypothetical protein